MYKSEIKKYMPQFKIGTPAFPYSTGPVIEFKKYFTIYLAIFIKLIF